jgi:hypothetical protein
MGEGGFIASLNRNKLMFDCFADKLVWDFKGGYFQGRNCFGPERIELYDSQAIISRYLLPKF